LFRLRGQGKFGLQVVPELEKGNYVRWLVQCLVLGHLGLMRAFNACDLLANWRFFIIAVRLKSVHLLLGPGIASRLFQVRVRIFEFFESLNRGQRGGKRYLGVLGGVVFSEGAKLI
jgi:hypothetical protein